jgi:uncharacterized repeat protein (TIGR01451 family)
MFEKLLSLVPYNPGLVHQLSFYSRRMREESNIRRTGLIFIVLAFLIQFFVVLNPPQPTMASSDNDLISGGIGTDSTPASEARAAAKQACLNDTRGYMHIMHWYGISCKEFNTAAKLTIHASARNYYSLGHNPSPGVDTPANIPGVGSAYWRKLTTWNKETWTVLRVHNQDGKVFYVIFDCGNLVSVGIPSPSPLQTIEVGPTESNVPAPTPTPTSPPAPCQYDSTLPANSPNCVPRCIYNNLIPSTDINCKPCDKSINSSDTIACISVHKTASNDTAGLADANNSTAHAGDIITYTLFATNSGKAAVDQFTFQENMSDVMDYANITDLHGGTLSSADKVVSWPTEKIDVGATATHQITVKVKDPVPQTPASTSDPMHFDLIMTNVYGNAVNIKLPGSPAKQVQVAAASLPNTGPGTTLFIAASVVIVAGYFYGRASLLARESNLAVKETAAV